MKKLFINLLFIFGFNLLQAQLVNSDFQHLKLKSHNYTISNQSALINTPDSLYKSQTLSYYQDLYKTGNIRRTTGLIVTLAGIAQIIPGAIMLTDAGFFYGTDDQFFNLLFGGFLTVSGSIAVIIGVSVGISGQVKRTKSKKAIENFNRNISLSFRTTNNGIGLVLKF